MFEKLISALPFNPGAVDKIAFYMNRVRSEQAVRRVGLVFIVLAFLVQFFAFVNPPQSSSAASPNDLVDGGFSSVAEAAQDCNSNVGNYGQMLANYGITCSDVANASTLTINSDGYGKNLWSMGRLNYALAGEAPVTIPGLNYQIYERYLWAWDSAGTSSTYQVLNVTVAGGQTFFLMYACGNLVSIGPPQPVQQPPSIQLSKTTAPGYPQANSTVAPGTVLGFRAYFNNTGGGASNVTVTDPEPMYTTETYQEPISGSTYSFSGAIARWNFPSMPSGASNWYVETHFEVNPNIPASITRVCNVATLTANGVATINSNSVCFNVKRNVPPPPPTPTPKPSQPTCEQQLSSENESACVSESKSATNVTENIANANGTTAQPGDVIKYSLSATNNGSDTVKAFQISDSLAYVLDYSTVTDAGGGTVDANNNISWPAEDIAAGQTLTKSFEVTVDNPIPQTPASSSDPNFFNLKLNNTYGNTITISLPTTPVAAIQTTAATLPNTGPGNGIMIGAVIVAIAGFFFYRSRLLVKESRIAISSQSGDM